MANADKGSNVRCFRHRYGRCYFLMAVDAPLRILAVDNDPSVTFSMRFIFDGPRYEITTMDSGPAALSQLDGNPDQYDVIIVDERMPNLTGVELVVAMRKRGITGKFIVVSAHLSREIRAAYQLVGVHVMLSKPFNIDSLRLAVDRCAA